MVGSEIKRKEVAMPYFYYHRRSHRRHLPKEEEEVGGEMLVLSEAEPDVSLPIESGFFVMVVCHLKRVFARLRKGVKHD